MARVILAKLCAVDYEPLMPAPSVGDAFLRPDNPTSANLWDTPLAIVSNYRGHTLYLENGALVYRSDPRTTSANGFVAIPDPSKGLCAVETCYVWYNNERWVATLSFV
jgi:hypothetical protein